MGSLDLDNKIDRVAYSGSSRLYQEKPRKGAKESQTDESAQRADGYAPIAWNPINFNVFNNTDLITVLPNYNFDKDTGGKANANLGMLVAIEILAAK